jgi:hypothetical protein
MLRTALMQHILIHLQGKPRRELKLNGPRSNVHRNNGLKDRLSNNVHRNNGLKDRHRINALLSKQHRNNGRRSKEHRNNVRRSKEHRNNVRRSKEHRNNVRRSKEHRNNGLKDRPSSNVRRNNVKDIGKNSSEGFENDE